MSLGIQLANSEIKCINCVFWKKGRTKTEKKFFSGETPIQFK